MSAPIKKEQDVKVVENAAVENYDENWSTVKREKAPSWTRENLFITDGYRPKLSWRLATKSIFASHTETGNIWTHLIATLLFIWLFLSTSVAILKLYSIGAIGCFGASTVFHVYFCVSEKSFSFLVTCDYVGILLHITTTGLVWLRIVFGFSIIGLFYMVCQVLLFLAVGWYVITHPRFHDLEMRSWRSAMFIIYVLPSIFPMSNIYHGYVDCASCVDGYMICGIGSCLVGVVFYVKSIPERYGVFGKYTSIVYSHNIFHTLVFVASIFFYLNFKKVSTEKNFK